MSLPARFIFDEALNYDWSSYGLLASKICEIDANLTEVFADGLRGPVRSKAGHWSCIPSKPGKNGHDVAAGSPRSDKRLDASFDDVRRHETYSDTSRRSGRRLEHQVDASHCSH